MQLPDPKQGRIPAESPGGRRLKICNRTVAFPDGVRQYATRRLHMSTDRIEKSIFLRAPRSRVWRAIATPEEFGTWFGVKLDGAFAPGKPVSGRITIKGYEN